MAKSKRKPVRTPRSKPRIDDRRQQVGRRPSPPLLLFGIAASWVVVGVVALTALSASWKLVPGIVFIGIGAMYLRAALTTVARRDRG